MDTPAALLDTLKMQRNLQRMHQRPHVKTHKWELACLR